MKNTLSTKLVKREFAAVYQAANNAQRRVTELAMVLRNIAGNENFSYAKLGYSFKNQVMARYLAAQRTLAALGKQLWEAIVKLTKVVKQVVAPAPPVEVVVEVPTQEPKKTEKAEWELLLQEEALSRIPSKPVKSGL